MAADISPDGCGSHLGQGAAKNADLTPRVADDGKRASRWKLMDLRL